LPNGPSQSLPALARDVVGCGACPRLVKWRESVATAKRAAYVDQEYWGRPVPGFGDPAAWLVVVGLAPGAHGANRTGRMFTGDRSGEWLYGALHRAGLSNRPTSTSRDDGLKLDGVWITSAVKCAPPDNRPSPGERDICKPFLARELDLLTGRRVLVCLGSFAYAQVLRLLKDRGAPVPTPRPRFEHGLEMDLGEDGGLLASYHPSQQNTFTGKLTQAMFDGIWNRALVMRT
jgi:uracil-DNA glycosylase family 4